MYEYYSVQYVRILATRSTFRTSGLVLQYYSTVLVLAATVSLTVLVLVVRILGVLYYAASRVLE
jgi:hypothetical protein